MKKLLLYIITILNYNAFSQNFQWVKEFGASSGEIYALCTTIDATGNVYTTGIFHDIIDFDPGPGTYTLASISSNSAINWDIFISKFDASGNFIWTKNMGGSYSIYGNSIITDISGNIYVTGEFRGTVDFDPNIGINQITSMGVNDIFVLKFDSNGNLSWVTTFGDTSIDYGKSIALDALGNIYITGGFKGLIDFDPGVGSYYVNSIYSDLFILKLDGLGNFGWVKTMGGVISSCEPNSINIDSQGNIYTTGRFYNQIDFDPSSTSTYTLDTNGGNIFVSKLNALGDFVWAKNMGSPTQSGTGLSITIDQFENVYTTGQFSGVADFDPNGGTYNLTSFGSCNIFVSKLDIHGNFVWAKSIGGTVNDVCSGNSIKIDPHGEIYLTGDYGGNIDFDPGNSVSQLSSNGHSSYLLKLDSSGNYLTVKDFNTYGYCYANSIAINAAGDVYVVGSYDRLTDFNNGLNIDTLSSTGYKVHSFMVKLGNNLTNINQIKPDSNSLTNIFPNPNDGTFNIVSKEKISLTIFDNLGKILQSVDLVEANGFQQTLQINTSGVYYINGITEQSSTQQKIIVTK